ncbi:MAG: indolepyruvate oxidoreductase [Spirochaetes bacterium GWD1_61_31]|nr:MAG: indolepyruvate oxidoreductase [Spirochaetes bacterium GWB1_60_80]OHD32037.1 MAG: indolepyruvate oxidoreductase [Spirochaetes bacterium GWC1_61_12]OHD40636.1 MAG: indolepyruvate oxidoreductase [Spirochaetes bacterium GWD1_61_31]OHD43908.1 MAG: indolepyruvate oxidoreductase [Spirochaetes bacterium GWE1_60_18]OHD59779.1 MAG: indolepyruvate oxidoreductase [Spirochaetes bacterium GWF1_60_12]HAP43494.1 indolepyruvate oxidoreductase subunit beta [Spirochaetaceae bacterium]
MKYDIVLCGVGGQGGISVSVVIARAAMAEGLKVKQSEVHGMSQRGGEVLAHLRLADKEPASPTIPLGGADLIISFEPLETLRYLPWLNAKTGLVISATKPLINMTGYPDLAKLQAELEALPNKLLFDADAVAREAGNVKAANIVLVGAASRSLPLKEESLKTAIRELFGRKGEAVVAANLKAFDYGRTANS